MLSFDVIGISLRFWPLWSVNGRLKPLLHFLKFNTIHWTLAVA